MSRKTFCDSCKNEVHNPIKPPISGSKVYGNRKVTFSIGISYSAELDICNSCLAKDIGEVVQLVNTTEVPLTPPASTVIDMSAANLSNGGTIHE